jgi:zinc protease
MTGLMAFPADLKVSFEKYTLKNGLCVILARDSAVPVVAVYLLYKVGARAEEKGRSGFAHLFEHMMFQGSAHAPKGVHFRLVESNGGVLNGSTHPDYTDYFELLPSNKLAVGLWLESDRMRSLAITPENLENQRAAVKEERRLSFDNQPYNTALIEKWPQLAYRNWSNAHSIIGSFEDLDAASVEDVAKFFKTYYVPNNAILALVGDLQPEEAHRLIEAYFGDIPPQPQPPPPDLTEPAGGGPRSAVHRDPLAQVPAVIVGYPGPARRSPDYNALVMADVLLTGGDSSRFQLDLVKGRQSVVSYQADLGWPLAGASDYKEPGMYAMFLLHKPQFSGQQMVAQVEEELQKLRDQPVDRAELDRARTFLRSSRINELQSPLNRARLLAQYEMFDGRPEWITEELNQFLSVTPAQIQAAVRKYFVPERRSVLEIVPAPKAAAASGK